MSVGGVPGSLRVGAEQPDRNLALELVRVTEAAAMAAGRWVLVDPVGGGGFSTWDRRGRIRVALEGHAAASWDAGLVERGHDIVRTDAWSPGFGHAHVIAVDNDRLAGAADPRALVSAAAGY